MEKYLRQFLRSSCDSKADVRLVCSDGVVYAHKFLLWGFLPALKQFLCSSCQDSHEEALLILPEVKKVEMEMARDFLYMFGDKEPLVNIFRGGSVKQTNIEILGQHKQVEIEPTQNAVIIVADLVKSDDEIFVKNDDNFDATSTDGLEENINSEEDEAVTVTKSVLGENVNKHRTKNVDEALILSTFIEKHISCKLCDLTFTSRAGFEKHKVKHTGAVFFCDKCKFTSKNKSSFQMHKRQQHSGKRIQCDECEYTGVSNQVIKNHKLIKHRGLKNTCEDCEYTSVSKSSLLDHRRSVHENMKFECEECDVAFNSRGGLKCHSQIKHLGIRYQCDYCEFRSTTVLNLRKHIVRQHN